MKSFLLLIFVILDLFCYLIQTQPISTESLLTKYNESLEAWKTLNFHTYTYVINIDLNIRLDRKTWIKVIDDEVEERTYRVWAGEELVEYWIEDGSEGQRVGGHRSSGAPVKTFEELYIQCRNEYLTQDPELYHIYFSSNNQGLMSYCGYRPKNCEDGCSVGFEIDEIQIIYDDSSFD